MSLAAVMLAAAVSTGAPAARIPVYPGSRAVAIAGSLVYTTPDPLHKVRTGYSAMFRKAGWKPSVAGDVLNGDVPGAGKADMEALRKAITYLSFERQGQSVDLFLGSGRDRQNRPITLITILRGDSPATDSPQGDRSGRP